MDCLGVDGDCWLCLQAPSPDNILRGSANGFAAGQIFQDAFAARFGSGTGGVILLGVPAGAMLL